MGQPPLVSVQWLGSCVSPGGNVSDSVFFLQLQRLDDFCDGLDRLCIRNRRHCSPHDQISFAQVTLNLEPTMCSVIFTYLPQYQYGHPPIVSLLTDHFLRSITAGRLLRTPSPLDFAALLFPHTTPLFTRPKSFARVTLNGTVISPSIDHGR